GRDHPRVLNVGWQVQPGGGRKPFAAKKNLEKMVDGLPSIETTRPLETAAAAATAARAVPIPSINLDLPHDPLIIIQASKSWVPLNLRELWAYRGLLYFLSLRDLKVRYK